MIDFLKKNKYHFFSSFVILFTFSFSITKYSFSLSRLFGSVLDFFDSIRCYFFRIILRDTSVVANVAELPDIDISAFLPFDWEELSYKLGNLGLGLFNFSNFANYLRASFEVMYNVLFVTTLIFPFVIILFVFIYNIILMPHKAGKSKPKKIYDNIVTALKPRFREVYRSYKLFLLKHKRYIVIFIGLWIINLNLVTIALSLLSYYFYILASFDFSFLFIATLRLLLDLIIMFVGLPLPIWIFLGLFIYKKIVHSIGRKLLKAVEKANQAIISRFPICVMFIGLMGTGKTLMLSDVVLSREVMYRDQALRDMYDITLRLPEFPFSAVEKLFFAGINDHSIYNLATCRKFVSQLCFDKELHYDYYNNPVAFYDEIKFETMWDLLSDYFQLFFIYITETYIISNYSVRSDMTVEQGYFPLYNSDFFDKDESRYYKSNFSHILDYDILRMARPVVEDNPNIGSLEFGILAATEYAKERLNTLERKKRKLDDTTTNADNDGVNDRLKMIRSSATVRGFCYINFYFDDQRNQSLDADNREIANIVKIKEKSKEKMMLPWICGGIYFDFIQPAIQKIYFKIRHVRDDDFLFLYLLHKLDSLLYKHYIKEKNYFGYYILNAELQAGTLDDEAVPIEYYISKKKTYSRYITDVLRDYFRVQTEECDVGINDMRCYESIVATVDEQQAQHSYFVERMTRSEQKK